VTWNQSETFATKSEADNGTLPTPATQSSGTVGAVTLSDPPGLEKETLTFSTFAFGESCFATMAPLDTHANFDHATNFHVNRTTFEALPDNVFHFNDALLAEHLIAPVVSSKNFVLFDSGAAANVCPENFASEWPLLPLTEPPPPLKAISGDFLNILGRRLVGMTFGNVEMFIHFYVCESIPYAIVSVARLLKQGYHVEMGPDYKTLRTPNDQLIPIEQHGSLLYLNAKIMEL